MQQALTIGEKRPHIGEHTHSHTTFLSLNQGANYGAINAFSGGTHHHYLGITPEQHKHVASKPEGFPSVKRYPPLGLYVSRKKLEERIINPLIKKIRDIVLLVGQPGNGKTKLAQHAVKILLKKFPKYNCFWFDARNDLTLSNSYKTLASQLETSFHGAEQNECLVSRVKNFLIEKNAGWILVFDDALSYDKLKSYLPVSDNNIIILTSKFKDEWSELNSKVQVDVGLMNESESCELFKETSGLESFEQQIPGLVQSMQYYPILISTFATYFKFIHRGCAIDYSDLIKVYKNYISNPVQALEMNQSKFIEYRDDSNQKKDEIKILLNDVVSKYQATNKKRLMIAVISCIDENNWYWSAKYEWSNNYIVENIVDKHENLHTLLNNKFEKAGSKAESYSGFIEKYNNQPNDVISSNVYAEILKEASIALGYYHHESIDLTWQLIMRSLVKSLKGNEKNIFHKIMLIFTYSYEHISKEFLFKVLSYWKDNGFSADQDNTISRVINECIDQNLLIYNGEDQSYSAQHSTLKYSLRSYFKTNWYTIKEIYNSKIEKNDYIHLLGMTSVIETLINAFPAAYVETYIRINEWDSMRDCAIHALEIYKFCHENYFDTDEKIKVIISSDDGKEIIEAFIENYVKFLQRLSVFHIIIVSDFTSAKNMLEHIENLIDITNIGRETLPHLHQSLSEAYYFSGDYEYALELMKIALDEKIEFYKDENHPECMATRHGIGELFTALNQFEKADKLYDLIVNNAIANDPEQAYARHSKAVILHIEMNKAVNIDVKKKKFESANDLLEIALTEKRKIFGYNFGFIKVLCLKENCAELGDENKEKLLSKKYTLFGKYNANFYIYYLDHKNQIQRKRVNNYKESLRNYFKRADNDFLKIKEENRSWVLDIIKSELKSSPATYGDNHPEIMTTLLELARLLLDFEDYHGAKEKYENILSLAQQRDDFNLISQVQYYMSTLVFLSRQDVKESKNLIEQAKHNQGKVIKNKMANKNYLSLEFSLAFIFIYEEAYSDALEKLNFISSEMYTNNFKNENFESKIRYLIYLLGSFSLRNSNNVDINLLLNIYKQLHVYHTQNGAWYYSDSDKEFGFNDSPIEKVDYSMLLKNITSVSNILKPMVLDELFLDDFKNYLVKENIIDESRAKQKSQYESLAKESGIVKACLRYLEKKGQDKYETIHPCILNSMAYLKGRSIKLELSSSDEYSVKSLMSAPMLPSLSNMRHSNEKLINKSESDLSNNKLQTDIDEDKKDLAELLC